MALFQKAFSREAWPSIQLLPDESLALHVVTNAINVYNPRDFAAGAVLRCHALHCRLRAHHWRPAEVLLVLMPMRACA